MHAGRNKCYSIIILYTRTKFNNVYKDYTFAHIQYIELKEPINTIKFIFSAGLQSVLRSNSVNVEMLKENHRIHTLGI